VQRERPRQSESSRLLAALSPHDDAEDEPGPLVDAEQGVVDAPVMDVSDALASGLKDGKIITGATAHRIVLFTFDDGPSRFTTPLLLDRLDANGIRAVFFLTASNMRGENVAERTHQEIARETARRGHVIGSHGTHHRQLPLLSDLEALLELSEAERIFRDVLGERPWLFRPPGGARSRRTDRLIGSRGYTSVLWNLGAGDFQVRSAEDVHATFRTVLERREAQGERGGIILLHDTYAWSVDAFQLIVDDLLARNCALLDQEGEELWDFADDPAMFFEARGDDSMSDKARPAEPSAEVLAWRQARLRADTELRCREQGVR
jgi:peptidoglycan/xylan/chitin deacetylase (PgdA/CDA1 family)